MKKTALIILFAILAILQPVKATIGSASVTTTASAIMLSDTTRMWWAISNNGATVAYIQFDGTTQGVTSSTGMQIAPGASVAFYGSAGASAASNVVWAISTGTTTLGFQYGPQR